MEPNNEFRVPYSLPKVSSPLLIMGIESTSHTFGIGLIEYEDGVVRVLANVSSQYVPSAGGIHPREASQHHANEAPRVLWEALEKARASVNEIDAVSVAMGPGLGPSLRVGASLARFLSSYYGIPLVPVNHAVAHLEIGKLASGFPNPLIIYVSGGNTLITAQRSKRYVILGETLDISLGNLIDTFAREIGIAPPYVISGKHAIDICAEWGEGFEPLPYAVKGTDLSYSGLLTAALIKAREAGSNREALGKVCNSLRETAFNMLLEVAERNLVLTGKDSILLVGGVASNAVLRRKLEILAEIYGVKYYGTPPSIAGDNGLMIAYTGLLQYLHGVSVRPVELRVRQRMRIDEGEYPWLPE